MGRVLGPVVCLSGTFVPNIGTVTGSAEGFAVFGPLAAVGPGHRDGSEERNDLGLDQQTVMGRSGGLGVMWRVLGAAWWD